MSTSSCRFVSTSSADPSSGSDGASIAPRLWRRRRRPSGSSLPWPDMIGYNRTRPPRLLVNGAGQTCAYNNNTECNVQDKPGSVVPWTAVRGGKLGWVACAPRDRGFKRVSPCGSPRVPKTSPFGAVLCLLLSVLFYSRLETAPLLGCLCPRLARGTGCTAGTVCRPLDVHQGTLLTTRTPRTHYAYDPSSVCQRFPSVNSTLNDRLPVVARGPTNTWSGAWSTGMLVRHRGLVRTFAFGVLVI